jgi:nitrogen-specific signal transduction histidine kinase
VVTIGHDQRVRTLNLRAAEILEADPDAVVGQDLRVLPAPLGEILYDTLHTGQPRPNAEVRITPRGLWIEVSAYPVRRDESIGGAVLVFEDRTVEKERAAQKREAEQFELLTRVIAQFADETRTPLVSINTFMELIDERFDDPEFRRHFSSIVRRDVRRVVQVFEKLTGLVSQGDLNFNTVDVHSVVAKATMVEMANETGEPIELRVTRDPGPLFVKVDPAQLTKAFAYLIRYLGQHSPEHATVSLSVSQHKERDGDVSVQIAIRSETATVPVQHLDRLFDPVRMAQEHLIDIGPAVSQRIVEALGGRLELRQSQHDFAFIVRLPQGA